MCGVCVYYNMRGSDELCMYQLGNTFIINGELVSHYNDCIYVYIRRLQLYTVIIKYSKQIIIMLQYSLVLCYYDKVRCI